MGRQVGGGHAIPHPPALLWPAARGRPGLPPLRPAGHPRHHPRRTRTRLTCGVFDDGGVRLSAGLAHRLEAVADPWLRRSRATHPSSTSRECSPATHPPPCCWRSITSTATRPPAPQRSAAGQEAANHDPGQGRVARRGPAGPRLRRNKAPNRTWVTDFTYVRTWAGFVYVAFVLDCFAQRIVAWHASTSKQTELVMIPTLR